MLTAAAVCPHPPLLVPEATGGQTGSDDLVRLRQACDAAVAALTAGSPDVLVVVGGADRSEQFPPDAPGSLQDYGVPFRIGTGDPVLPLSLTIGRWLLTRALLTRAPDAAPAAALCGVAAGAAPDECLAIGADLAGLAPSVAMLAMGDGPGRRARRAPRAADPAADDYDDAVSRALASADPAAIAALDPAHDAALFVAGRAAWQVMAGAMRATPGSFQARMHYAGAPFEVSYYAVSLRQH